MDTVKVVYLYENIIKLILLVAKEYFMNETKKFVNEYEYNRKIVEESLRSWWNKKFKNNYVIIGMVIIILIILFLMTFNIHWLLLTIILFLPILLVELKKRIAIKTELDRLSVVYKEKIPVIKVIIDKDIKLITSNSEKSIEFSSIESFTETKNLIVLMIKGSMTVPLSKKGFIEGTYEDFLTYLKEIIKK